MTCANQSATLVKHKHILEKVRNDELVAFFFRGKLLIANKNHPNIPVDDVIDAESLELMLDREF